MVRGSPAPCAQVSTFPPSHIQLVSVFLIFLYVLRPAGVFMEKPHSLYPHTTSFKFSTHPQSPGASNVRRSSTRRDSSTNETSTTFTADEPQHSLSLSSLLLLI